MNRPCSEKSYIDDDGEAGELNKAWFAKPVVGGQNYPVNCANSGYRLFLIQMSSHISKARGVAGKQGLMQR